MRKGWGVLLASLVAVLSAAGSAHADPYDCASVTVDGSGTLSVANRCGESQYGMQVTGTTGQGGARALVLSAPANATIAAARLYHRATLPTGAVLRLVAASGGSSQVVDAVTGPAAPDHTTAGQALTLPAGTTQLRYELDCGTTCAGVLDARLPAADLTVGDVDDPGVTVQASLSGTVLTATATATDGATGIEQLKLLLDGRLLLTRDLTCPALPQPCALRAEETFAPDVGTLADGAHRVRVEARDAGGRLGAADLDLMVDRQPPAGAGVPGIVGLPEVGQTLVASRGEWSGQNPSFSYRWERCNGAACVPIAGADGSSYVVREEDQEQELRVVETATDGGGGASLASGRTARVSPQVPVLVEPLQVTGDVRVGGRLTGAGGAWRNVVALRYQWLSCSRRDGSDCVTLPGRERPTLELERDDVGRYMVLVVTATGPRGHTAQTSAASPRIPYPPLRNLTQPSIGGNATLGGRLTAETGAWEGESVRYETQWLRCNSTGCLPIDGAIARSYKPTSRDLGHQLVVLVTGRDAMGETLPVRSPATERVRSSSGKALPVPRVRTKVRIVSFGDFQFALTVGPKLQVLDVGKGSRVDVLCRLCARTRLGRRSKVKTSTVTFRLPSDGVQIPPGGKIVVRVRRKGTIGREIVGTLSLDRSRRVSWGSVKCLAKDASLRTVACPAKVPRKKKTTKKKTTTKKTSTQKTSTEKDSAAGSGTGTTPAAA